MIRALVQDAPDVTTNQGGNTPSPEGGDPHGDAATSEAGHAVAQSLAADVLAALAVEADELPPGEPWQAFGVGDASLAPPLGASLPVFEPLRAASQGRLDSPAVEQAAKEAAAEAIYAELRSDVARLEDLLAAQSTALREARAEVEQLRALGRDAASRFETLPDEAVELVRARAEREHAAARAIEAEAGRAEIAFQLDEVRGHLLGAGAGEGGLPGEPVHITCARLAGTVRGLLAARAEAEERRDIGWARALLLEQDLEDARIAGRSLERELVDVREHHELALVEARSLADRLAGAVDARAAAELRGENAGLRARSAEAERALESAKGRFGELERALARETESFAEAESQLAEGEAERLIASAQIERLQTALSSVQAELDGQEAELEQARALQRGELDRLSEARASVERLAAERGRGHALSTQTLHQVRAALAELSAAVERVMRIENAPVSDRTEPGGPLPIG